MPGARCRCTWGWRSTPAAAWQSDIRDVRTAIIKFLNANEHAVDTTLVDFDTEVRLARYGRPTTRG